MLKASLSPGLSDKPVMAHAMGSGARTGKVLDTKSSSRPERGYLGGSPYAYAPILEQTGSTAVDTSVNASQNASFALMGTSGFKKLAPSMTVLEMKPQEIRVDPIPRNHQMPENCRVAINEWFRCHPSLPFESLPCITRSSESRILTSDGIRPLAWIDSVSGSRLRVTIYSMVDTQIRSDGVYKDNKIVVVYGMDLPTSIVAHTNPDRQDFENGLLPVKSWAGVTGDKYGWERDHPVLKCNDAASLARFRNMLKYNPEDAERNIGDGQHVVASKKSPGLYSTLPSHQIPATVLEDIRQWYTQHKHHAQFPFALTGSMIPGVQRSKDGFPATFKTTDGSSLAAAVYSLPRMWTSNTNNKYFIIAKDSSEGYSIIGRCPSGSGVSREEGIAYRKWLGPVPLVQMDGRRSLPFASSGKVAKLANCTADQSVPEVQSPFDIPGHRPRNHQSSLIRRQESLAVRLDFLASTAQIASSPCQRISRR